VAVAPVVKGGEPVRREITITARTELMFSNVGPDGARLTEGYRVFGWLEEGSEDAADELVLSRPEMSDGKKADAKREVPR
jgi:hypothetical protein